MSRPTRWPVRVKRGKLAFYDEVGQRKFQSFSRFNRARAAADTTINRHMNSLWLLGGAIIYRVNMDPKLRELDGKQLILRFVDEEGGPISKHLTTEKEQKKFDATCKRLYRFQTQKAG